MEEKQIRMSEEELREFQAFRAEKARKEEEARRRSERDSYREMVDAEIAAAIPELRNISGDLKAVKDKVYENFRAILEMKADMFRRNRGEEMGNFSHTFTSSDGRMCIVLGSNACEGYLDTAEDGVAMVREYIESLAMDEKSRALVSMVLKLLARDAKGTLKAQRIVQLHKLADESGNAKFQEGVRIIEEAYVPSRTSTYIKARVKDDNGVWRNIPLSMTDVN